MSKNTLLSRILQLRVSTCVIVVLSILTVSEFFYCYGTYNYTHLAPDQIEATLYKEISPTLVLKKTKPDCTYEHVLRNTESMNSWDARKTTEDAITKGLVNGSYIPEDCNPLFSVAILVTYRNRQSQLNTFIPYLHAFLRHQNIHYKIYLIEQLDEKSWNKGLLYNIGAKQAIADRFPCLILHDVDLLPLDLSNLYACSAHPRHLSASLDKFRYVLTYDWLVGGALAIRADQYKEINGFSNRFEGWGGEDDDFARRILENKLSILRYPREMSRYTMLVHPSEARNALRLRIMRENTAHAHSDGLDSLRYEAVTVKPSRLFTVVGVKL